MGPGGLWILPIDGKASLDEDEPEQAQNSPSIAAATVHTLPYKQQKVKYMYQTFFAMAHTIATTFEKTILKQSSAQGHPNDEYKRHIKTLTDVASHAKRQNEKAKRRHKKHTTRKG